MTNTPINVKVASGATVSDEGVRLHGSQEAVQISWEEWARLQESIEQYAIANSDKLKRRKGTAPLYAWAFNQGLID